MNVKSVLVIVILDADAIGLFCMHSSHILQIPLHDTSILI